MVGGDDAVIFVKHVDGGNASAHYHTLSVLHSHFVLNQGSLLSVRNGTSVTISNSHFVSTRTVKATLS